MSSPPIISRKGSLATSSPTAAGLRSPLRSLDRLSPTVLAYIDAALIRRLAREKSPPKLETELREPSVARRGLRTLAFGVYALDLLEIGP
ncbi:hypothetical protein AYL99_12086 [Fonsecaea erecta]|uniref:Uncharacterized protein n=1 Tax=Fonsecaea erecta TaxID=1367422 RepID=A0A178Z3R6_9EURO|nr:hypothetical protein AYL99_12086 [Fonsecaea erecta]OAP53735.1 hypothetical protein AYL99_12086 [Fonsecaea erecta]